MDLQNRRSHRLGSHGPAVFRGKTDRMWAIMAKAISGRQSRSRTTGAHSLASDGRRLRTCQSCEAEMIPQAKKSRPSANTNTMFSQNGGTYGGRPGADGRGASTRQGKDEPCLSC